MTGPACDPWLIEPEEPAARDIHAFVDAMETGRVPDLDTDLTAHLTEILIAGYSRQSSSGR